MLFCGLAVLQGREFGETTFRDKGILQPKGKKRCKQRRKSRVKLSQPKFRKSLPPVKVILQTKKTWSMSQTGFKPTLCSTRNTFCYCHILLLLLLLWPTTPTAVVIYKRNPSHSWKGRKSFVTSWIQVLSGLKIDHSLIKSTFAIESICRGTSRGRVFATLYINHGEVSASETTHILKMESCGTPSTMCRTSKNSLQT